MDTKKFIQYAWVVETAVCVLASIVFATMKEIMPLWVTSLPYLTALIAGQGAAASIGPAIIRKAQIMNGGSECVNGK